MENSSLNTYLKLKEAGIGELNQQEDGTFIAHYVPYDELTGQPKEQTTITLSRDDLTAQRNQLLQQLDARNDEMSKIKAAKDSVLAQIEKIEEVLKDMDDVSPVVPVVLATP